MNIAYFDCFAGASGDMILGALVDAGVPLSRLEDGLRAMALRGYRLEAVSARRGSMTGTKVTVVLEGPPEDPPRRSLADVEALLAEGELPPAVIGKAQRVFRRLAAAEATIHGIPVQEVHFHEVGAIDALVDVVGTLLALDLLNVGPVYCSPLPGGTGVVKASHGLLPLPAPATLALIAEVNAPLRPPPVARDDLGELVTPTAAALLTTLATFAQPPMLLERAGYGVGTRDHPELPNILRVWLGQEAAGAAVDASGPTQREVQLLETNIDDMNPEMYGYVAELLFQAGALDVWWTPIQMKKNRPGVHLNVLTLPADASTLAALLLQETSTLGVRTHILQRWEAEREVAHFESTLGPTAVKVRRWQGKVTNIAPEYEACRSLAQRHGLPLREIYRRIEAEGWAYLSQHDGPQ